MDRATIGATDPLRHFPVEAIRNFLDRSHFTLFQKLASIPAKRPLLGDTAVSTFSRKGFNKEGFLEGFMLRATAWISTLTGFKGHSLFSRIRAIEIIAISALLSRLLENHFISCLSTHWAGVISPI